MNNLPHQVIIQQPGENFFVSKNICLNELQNTYAQNYNTKCSIIQFLSFYSHLEILHTKPNEFNFKAKGDDTETVWFYILYYFKFSGLKVKELLGKQTTELIF